MDPSRDLNNKIILLRKSLKSILNQTKLNLAKKVKKGKEQKKNVTRKENELECFKRVKPSEIPLNLGLYPDKLYKTITNSSSIEIDRVYARILLNPLIQKTLNSLKEKFEVERVEKFLKSNEKRVKSTELKRLTTINTPKSVKKKDSSDPESDEDDEAEVEVKKTSKVYKNKKLKTDKDEEKPQAKSEKTLDPFFVSTSGQNYMSSIANNSSDDDDSHQDKVRYPAKQKQQPVKRKVQSNKSQPSVAPKRPRESEIVSKKATQPTANEEQDMHPSWKAKQQMKKLQIQEFKGTKIKFDD